LIAGVPSRAERPEGSADQDSGHYISLEVFILLLVMLTIVLWECVKGYCRRPAVTPLRVALLDVYTQTTQIGETPRVMQKVSEADIYIATGGSSDKFHTRSSCRGLNNANRGMVEHRVLCQ
jgi:hypothetical protein